MFETHTLSIDISTIMYKVQYHTQKIYFYYTDVELIMFLTMKTSQVLLNEIFSYCVWLYLYNILNFRSLRKYKFVLLINDFKFIKNNTIKLFAIIWGNGMNSKVSKNYNYRIVIIM